MEEGAVEIIFSIICYLLLRIGAILICVYKAKSLNRGAGRWGLFGFCLPIPAIIWIQFMKPIMKWDENINIDKKKG
jgi:hypothetical protein